MADLTGVDRKIQRAKQHLAELEREIEAALDASPGRFAGEMDAVTGDYIIRVHDLPSVSPDWGLLVGDAIHNARAALDHLAWQLVLLDGGSSSPTDKTQFPIRDSPFDKKGRWITPQIQPGINDSKIIDALEAVQPYRGPDGGPAIYHRSHLWRLHRLDITDKHRLLLVVRVAVDPGQMWWDWHNDRPPGVSVNFQPLEEGSELVRFLVGGIEPPPDFDPHPALAISLREREVRDVGPIPIVRVVSTLIRWVDEYVVNDHFRPLFP